jgi:L-threonylcarbamoyladenylate synthase
MSDLDRTAAAIRDGNLVVYPTETVYGLGADALDPAVVDRVYETKGRDRSNPISLAVPDIDAAESYVRPTERERAFMERFLPGPVTVLCERRDVVPDVLTAGSDRVGVRIPDHDLALALLDRVEPITATSANVSGRPSARTAEDVDEEVRKTASAVLDGGETGGVESTVVDVVSGEIHRPGALSDEIEIWLAEH